LVVCGQAGAHTHNAKNDDGRRPRSPLIIVLFAGIVIVAIAFVGIIIGITAVMALVMIVGVFTILVVGMIAIVMVVASLVSTHIGQQ
jgi:hypothetical protein